MLDEIFSNSIVIRMSLDIGRSISLFEREREMRDAYMRMSVPDLVMVSEIRNNHVVCFIEASEGQQAQRLS